METIICWFQSDVAFAIFSIIGYLLIVCLIAITAFFIVAVLEWLFRLLFIRH